MTATSRHGRAGAFTLLELLIASVVLAVLTSIAVPSWQAHVARGWRGQARAAMIAAMLELERHALAAMSFTDASNGHGVVGEWPRAVPPPPARARHVIHATACPAADLDRCVELRAIPQIPDRACGTLILRSTGEWLSEPDSTGAPVPWPADC